MIEDTSNLLRPEEKDASEIQVPSIFAGVKGSPAENVKPITLGDQLANEKLERDIRSGKVSYVPQDDGKYLPVTSQLNTHRINLLGPEHMIKWGRQGYGELSRRAIEDRVAIGEGRPTSFYYDPDKAYDETFLQGLGTWISDGWEATTKLFYNSEARLKYDEITDAIQVPDPQWTEEKFEDSWVQFSEENKGLVKFTSILGIDLKEQARSAVNELGFRFNITTAVEQAISRQRMQNYSETTGAFAQFGNSLYYGIQDPTILRDAVVMSAITGGATAVGLATKGTSLLGTAARGTLQVASPLTGFIEGLAYRGIQGAASGVGQRFLPTVLARSAALAAEGMTQGTLINLADQRDQFEIADLMFKNVSSEFKYDWSQVATSAAMGSVAAPIAGLALRLGLGTTVGGEWKVIAARDWDAWKKGITGSIDHWAYSSKTGLPVFGEAKSGGRGLTLPFLDIGRYIDSFADNVKAKTTLADVMVNNQHLYSRFSFSPALAAKIGADDAAAKKAADSFAEATGLPASVLNSADVDPRYGKAFEFIIDPENLKALNLTHDEVATILGDFASAKKGQAVDTLGAEALAGLGAKMEPEALVRLVRLAAIDKDLRTRGTSFLELSRRAADLTGGDDVFSVKGINNTLALAEFELATKQADELATSLRDLFSLDKKLVVVDEAEGVIVNGSSIVSVLKKYFEFEEGKPTTAYVSNGKNFSIEIDSVTGRVTVSSSRLTVDEEGNLKPDVSHFRSDDFESKRISYEDFNQKVEAVNNDINKLIQEAKTKVEEKIVNENKEVFEDLKGKTLNEVLQKHFGLTKEEAVAAEISMTVLGYDKKKAAIRWIRGTRDLKHNAEFEPTLKKKKSAFRAIIRTSQTADFGSLIHEMGHYARYAFFGPDGLSKDFRVAAGITDEMYKRFLGWLGKTEEAWETSKLSDKSIAAEEKFANGLATYIRQLMSGKVKAPSTAVQRLFHKLGDHLGLVGEKMKSQDELGLELTPEADAVFSALINAGNEKISGLFDYAFKEVFAKLPIDKRDEAGKFILGEVEYNNYLASLEKSAEPAEKELAPLTDVKLKEGLTIEGILDSFEKDLTPKVSGGEKDLDVIADTAKIDADAEAADSLSADIRELVEAVRAEREAEIKATSERIAARNAADQEDIDALVELLRQERLIVDAGGKPLDLNEIEELLVLQRNNTHVAIREATETAEAAIEERAPVEIERPAVIDVTEPSPEPPVALAAEVTEQLEAATQEVRLLTINLFGEGSQPVVVRAPAAVVYDLVVNAAMSTNNVSKVADLSADELALVDRLVSAISRVSVLTDASDSVGKVSKEDAEFHQSIKELIDKLVVPITTADKLAKDLNIPLEDAQRFFEIRDTVSKAATNVKRQKDLEFVEKQQARIDAGETLSSNILGKLKNAKQRLLVGNYGDPLIDTGVASAVPEVKVPAFTHIPPGEVERLTRLSFAKYPDSYAAFEEFSNNYAQAVAANHAVFSEAFEKYLKKNKPTGDEATFEFFVSEFTAGRLASETLQEEKTSKKLMSDFIFYSIMRNNKVVNRLTNYFNREDITLGEMFEKLANTTERWIMRVTQKDDLIEAIRFFESVILQKENSKYVMASLKNIKNSIVIDRAKSSDAKAVARGEEVVETVRVKTGKSATDTVVDQGLGQLFVYMRALFENHLRSTGKEDLADFLIYFSAAKQVTGNSRTNFAKIWTREKGTTKGSSESTYTRNMNLLKQEYTDFLAKEKIDQDILDILIEEQFSAPKTEAELKKNEQLLENEDLDPNGPVLAQSLKRKEAVKIHNAIRTGTIKNARELMLAVAETGSDFASVANYLATRYPTLERVPVFAARFVDSGEFETDGSYLTHYRGIGLKDAVIMDVDVLSVHETIHALTSDAIQNYFGRRLPNATLEEYLDELDRILIESPFESNAEVYVRDFVNLYINLTKNTIDDFGVEVAERIYELSDINEFITGVLTSRDFRQFLANSPLDSSAVSPYTSAARAMLGIHGLPETALNASIFGYVFQKTVKAMIAFNRLDQTPETRAELQGIAFNIPETIQFFRQRINELGVVINTVRAQDFDLRGVDPAVTSFAQKKSKERLTATTAKEQQAIQKLRNDLKAVNGRLRKQLDIENPVFAQERLRLIDERGEPTFVKVGGQLGSNKAMQIKFNDGTKAYVKTTKSPSHAANEIAANLFYKRLTDQVHSLDNLYSNPSSHKMLDGGTLNPRILTEAEAAALDDYSFTLNPAIITKWQEVEKFNPNDEAQLRAASRNFAITAWLANWDYAGLDFDNIDAYGNIVLDAGGSLLWRAMGGPKGDAFGPVVSELKTLVDPSIAPQNAKIFSYVTPDDLKRQMVELVVMFSDTVIENIVNEAYAKAYGVKNVNDLETSVVVEADSLIDTLAQRRDYLANAVQSEDKLPLSPASIKKDITDELYNEINEALGNLDEKLDLPAASAETTLSKVIDSAVESPTIATTSLADSISLHNIKETDVVYVSGGLVDYGNALLKIKQKGPNPLTTFTIGEATAEIKALNTLLTVLNLNSIRISFTKKDAIDTAVKGKLLNEMPSLAEAEEFYQVAAMGSYEGTNDHLSIKVYPKEKIPFLGVVTDYLFNLLPLKDSSNIDNIPYRRTDMYRVSSILDTEDPTTGIHNTLNILLEMQAYHAKDATREDIFKALLAINHAIFLADKQGIKIEPLFIQKAALALDSFYERHKDVLGDYKFYAEGALSPNFNLSDPDWNFNLVAPTAAGKAKNKLKKDSALTKQEVLIKFSRDLQYQFSNFLSIDPSNLSGREKELFLLSLKANIKNFEIPSGISITIYDLTSAINKALVQTENKGIKNFINSSSGKEALAEVGIEVLAKKYPDLKVSKELKTAQFRKWANITPENPLGDIVRDEFGQHIVFYRGQSYSGSDEKLSAVQTGHPGGGGYGKFSYWGIERAVAADYAVDGTILKSWASVPKEKLFTISAKVEESGPVDYDKVRVTEADIDAYLELNPNSPYDKNDLMFLIDKRGIDGIAKYLIEDLGFYAARFPDLIDLTKKWTITEAGEVKSIRAPHEQWVFTNQLEVLKSPAALSFKDTITPELGGPNIFAQKKSSELVDSAEALRRNLRLYGVHAETTAEDIKYIKAALGETVQTGLGVGETAKALAKADLSVPVGATPELALFAGKNVRDLSTDERRQFALAMVDRIEKAMGTRSSSAGIYSAITDSAVGKRLNEFIGGSVSYGDTADSRSLLLQFFAKIYDPTMDLRDAELQFGFKMPSVDRVNTEVNNLWNQAGLIQVRDLIIDKTGGDIKRLAEINDNAWKYAAAEAVPDGTPDKALVQALVDSIKRLNQKTVEIQKKYGGLSEAVKAETYGTAHRPGAKAYSDPAGFADAMHNNFLKKTVESKSISAVTADALGWIDLIRDLGATDDIVRVKVVNEDILNLIPESKRVDDNIYSWEFVQKLFDGSVGMLNDKMQLVHNKALQSVTEDYRESYRKAYATRGDKYTAVRQSAEIAVQRHLGQDYLSDTKTVKPRTESVSGGRNYGEERIMDHNELVADPVLADYFDKDIYKLTHNHLRSHITDSLMTKQLTEFFGGANLTFLDALNMLRTLGEEYRGATNKLSLRDKESLKRGYQRIEDSWTNNIGKSVSSSDSIDKHMKTLLENGRIPVLIAAGLRAAGTSVPETLKAILKSDKHRSMITQVIPNLVMALKLAIGKKGRAEKKAIISASHWIRNLSADHLLARSSLVPDNPFGGVVFGAHQEGFISSFINNWRVVGEINSLEPSNLKKTMNYIGIGASALGRPLAFVNDITTTLHLVNAQRNITDNAKKFKRLVDLMESKGESVRTLGEFKRLAREAGLQANEALDMHTAGVLTPRNVELLIEAANNQSLYTDGMLDSRKMFTLWAKDDAEKVSAINAMGTFVSMTVKHTNVEPTLLDLRIARSPWAKAFSVFAQFMQSFALQQIGKRRRYDTVSYSQNLLGLLLMEAAAYGITRPYDSRDEEWFFEEAMRNPVDFSVRTVTNMPMLGSYQWVSSLLRHGVMKPIELLGGPEAEEDFRLPDLFGSSTGTAVKKIGRWTSQATQTLLELLGG